MNAKQSTVILRSQRFQVINACGFGLMTLLLSIGLVQASTLEGRVAAGVPVVIGVVLVVRALRAATMLIQSDRLVIRGLLSTRSVSRSDVRRFDIEVGPVVLRQRAYLTLIRTDGRKDKLTEFTRSPEDVEALKATADVLGKETLGWNEETLLGRPKQIP